MRLRAMSSFRMCHWCWHVAVSRPIESVQFANETSFRICILMLAMSGPMRDGNYWQSYNNNLSASALKLKNYGKCTSSQVWFLRWSQEERLGISALEELICCREMSLETWWWWWLTGWWWSRWERWRSLGNLMGWSMARDPIDTQAGRVVHYIQYVCSKP